MRNRGSGVWGLVILVVFGMHPRAANGAACPLPVFAIQAPRGGDHAVLRVPDYYEYVPSIMHDGAYRMWLCQGHYEGVAPGRTYHGDQIAHATAPTPSGPWSTPVPVSATPATARASTACIPATPR